ncbi:MAG TPA: c-type cytochrome [Pirellulaceae bacterium]|nr:c-type cytochrome [Pirellulaceae bacterium]
MAYRLASLLTAVAICLPALSIAQSPNDEEDDGEFRDGLIGTYLDQRGTSVTRVDRTVVQAWDGSAIDRRLAAGPIQAEWTGYLMSQAPGTYRLKAFYHGRLSIELAGRIVLEAANETPSWQETEALSLPFDYHRLKIRFSSTEPRGQLALFWSGPQFQLEPIASRQFHHDPKSTPNREFERGEQLVHALRCTACHQLAGEPAPRRAPAIDRLSGNLSYAWLVDWLTSHPDGNTPSAIARQGQMPSFGFSKREAADVATYLIDRSKPPPRAATDPKKADREKGRELFLSSGCLACHQLGDLGAASLFGGGDLTHIAGKRPKDFFARRMTNPAKINEDHRMPLFEFSKNENRDLVAFLQSLDGGKDKPREIPAVDLRQLDRGKNLVETAQCASCHRLPGAQPASRPSTTLSGRSNWATSCLQPATTRHDRPSFALNTADQQAIKRFVREVGSGPMSVAAQGKRLLRENNCLACHPRDAAQGLAGTATRAAAAHEQLSSLLPAMIPPSLASVGDKLHDRALTEIIGRKRSSRRNYLRVRMPRFVLNDEQLQSIVHHFVTLDRIPAGQEPTVARTELDAITLSAAGSRLVTPDGFGCTSCHQIGRVLPVKAPVNARGPNLTTLGDYVRRPWFDRFVRNPARIVPRMEMPSVRVAVHGLLDDNVNHQLSAVWDVLNTQGFQPPRPDPVRVVRHTRKGHGRAVMLTDVIRSPAANYLKPLLVGLPNRHSMLFDLAGGRLTTWSVGDVARQHTEGKTWFWEAAGTPVLETKLDQPEVSLVRRGVALQPVVQGQFLTELDAVQHAQQGLTANYRLRFATDDKQTPTALYIAQTFAPLAVDDTAYSGIQRSLVISNVPTDATVRLRLLASALAAKNIDGKTLVIDNHTQVRLVAPGKTRFSDDGVVTLSPNAKGKVQLTLAYATTVPVDQFPVLPVPAIASEPVSLNVVPGYEAVRVPLETSIMPTGLAWRPNGELVVSSLKGRVWTVQDTDGDALEDQITQFSDELAAPYGLVATDSYVDVVNKYGLLRLYDDDGDGRADRHETIASGWGHTTDYHDWAVGLPRDAAGNYYIAIPCQQDKRSVAAAHLRGTVLRLTPREPTVENPRAFELETLTTGHRFPMGIAMNRAEQLFVTDNQGNYNPFNELNHVRPGRRFGFINTVDRKPDFKPPLTPPAIDIPHPWTRSVNGICFLETPEELSRKSGGGLFGPFEGHLVGCEYDTRRLIRISLQQVGDTIQGAAYPFSYDEPPSGVPLLGPLVSSISPMGDLYIGGIRDSGWGGANNVGELVRLRPTGADLPCGIAEVRATNSGFVVEFTNPADPVRAADVANYTLASYTRISTPAYGGDDSQRRVESIHTAEVAADARSVKLTVGSLRPGFVYEVNLRNLSPDGGEFFPSQAHYTLRVIPD